MIAAAVLTGTPGGRWPSARRRDPVCPTLPVDVVDRLLGRVFRLELEGLEVSARVVSFDDRGYVMLRTPALRVRGHKLPAAMLLEAIAAGLLEEI